MDLEPHFEFTKSNTDQGGEHASQEWGGRKMYGSLGQVRRRSAGPEQPPEREAEPVVRYVYRAASRRPEKEVYYRSEAREPTPQKPTSSLAHSRGDMMHSPDDHESFKKSNENIMVFTTCRTFPFDRSTPWPILFRISVPIEAVV